MEPLDVRALALHLFEAGRITMAQAARLADVPLEEFVAFLGQAGIDAVSYPPEDLEEEVKTVG